jgi:hypothetical protein
VQEQECNEESLEEEVKNKEITTKSKIHDAKMLPCATTCQIGNQRNQPWGNCWPPSKNRFIPHPKLGQLLLGQT